MRPQVQYDGWEEWFYQHEEELINDTYIPPSQKIKFKQTLPYHPFSSNVSQIRVHHCNPFAIKPCFSSFQTPLFHPNKPFTPKNLLNPFTPLHQSLVPVSSTDLPATSAPATGKNTAQPCGATFVDFSRRPDGFRLQHTASPSPLQLSPVVNFQETGMAGSSEPISVVPLDAIPGDSELVEFLNPSIDSSYVHIPLNAETTTLLFPLSSLNSSSLLLNRKVAPTFEYAKFKSLPRGDLNWNAWVSRLKKFDGNVWRQQGLYQLIQMSMVDTTFSLDLLDEVIRLWASPCNSFILPCGPMSISLQDILQFTGLPLLGNDFAGLVDTSNLPQLSEKFLNPSSYSQAIRPWYDLKRTSPTSDERIAFMWVLICKYLFCPSSGKPTIEYLALARSLSVGNVHGLGVMFLGSVYRWLNIAVSDAPLSKLNGVLWILQMWLFSYFPELKSPPGNITDHFSWRELLSCHSDFTVPEAFSFMQSLPFHRQALRPRQVTVIADHYPWIGHMANMEQTDVSSIVDAVNIAILHPRFLVPDGTSPRELNTHSFEFYNPSLYPPQLGIYPCIPSDVLYLPQPISDMMKLEISQKRLTSLTLIELSEQSKLFKSPIIMSPISKSDDYLSWWIERHAALIPDALEIPVTQGIKRKLDLSATRNTKKTKSSSRPSMQSTEGNQQETSTESILPRRRTRFSTKLLGMASKLNPCKTAEHVILEDDNKSSSSDTSKDDSKTESNDHSRLVSQTPSIPPTDNLETEFTSSSPKDLLARRAMVSIIEDDTNFDFSFLSSGPSQPASSSFMPSGLDLATAKASLRHFLTMNLSNLGTIEKATVLSAASMLKSSSEFFQSPAFGILDTLDSMFTSFQDSSSTCSETLIQVGNFKTQKEKLDGMISERKAILLTLQQKNQDFDAKEELVRKLEVELVQHKADMMTFLHDSEALKVSSDRLKSGIQSLGDELVNQKEAYQLWEDTLKKAETVRADCLSKWEDLRKLDLS